MRHQGVATLEKGTRISNYSPMALAQMLVPMKASFRINYHPSKLINPLCEPTTRSVGPEIQKILGGRETPNSSSEQKLIESAAGISISKHSKSVHFPTRH